MSEGTCNVFPRAEYAYKGATKNDQAWIDDTIESGVAACKFERPMARPTDWDRPFANVTAPPPPPSAKKKWWQRRSDLTDVKRAVQRIDRNQRGNERSDQ